MKKLIYRAAGFFGFEKSKINTRSFDYLYSHHKALESQNLLIFDIGAHQGESIERFKNVFPQKIVEVVSFEPDPSNFSSLQTKFAKDQYVNIVNVGVGARSDTLQFNRLAKSDTSSFLEIDLESDWVKARSRNEGREPKDFVTKSQMIPIIKIDDYLSDKGLSKVDILKIDTQGFDLEVLLGAKSSIENEVFNFIEIELILAGPYTKLLRFKDLEDFFEDTHYKLYGIQSGNNYFRSGILQFDLLYVHKEHFITKYNF